MEEKIYNLAQKLAYLIQSNPDVVFLKKIETEMENNDEVIKLCYEKDLRCSEYSDILKYHSKDDKEAVDTYEKAKASIDKLNNNEIVKNYSKTYAKVNDLLYKINLILFDNVIEGEPKCR